MKRYYLYPLLVSLGATIGAGFQQLRIDEQQVFWQNSLTRYNLLATAYRNDCLPVAELDRAVEALGLGSEAISESSDSRVNLVFVQTGSVEPFSKDLGNMKFHLNRSERCVSLSQ